MKFDAIVRSTAIGRGNRSYPYYCTAVKKVGSDSVAIVLILHLVKMATIQYEKKIIS